MFSSKRLPLLLGMLGVAGIVSAYAQLAITPSTDANALASSLVGGNGLAISSATYSGASGASGFFSGGSGILPFKTGIVLTSGQAAGAIGPNTVADFGLDNGAPGNAALSALSGQETFNASVLTIHFTPNRGTVSFQYVFASEEYPEWVNQFNDVFAFFLNDTNIALIPGTQNPVSIDTVNDVNPSNLPYYADNTKGTRNIQYDGLVGVSLSLYATGPVNPGVDNVMRLAIADSRDPILDSAVFIAGGSFIDEPPPTINPVPEPATFGAVAIAALMALILHHRRRAA